jgi:hypothetical protein
MVATKLPKEDYAALARALLHGEPPPQHLKERLVTLTAELHSLSFEGAARDGRMGLPSYFLLFCSWYRTLEHIRAGRLKETAPEIKTITDAVQNATRSLLPAISRALALGDPRPLAHLAAVIEAARGLALLQDVGEMRRITTQLFRKLGLEGGKTHKRTERLRALFPLWYFGFGRLPYAQKCEVLEAVGALIPEDDALRALLSYHGIPEVVKSLELERKQAGTEGPSKSE